MKRFFLIFLAFTVSLGAFSVLLPAKDTRASSPYDNTLQIWNDNLKAGRYVDGARQYTTQEFGAALVDFRPGSSTCSNDDINAFATNITDGKNYAIVQNVYNDTDEPYIQLYVDTDGSGVDTQWSTNAVNSFGFDRQLTLRWTGGGVQNVGWSCGDIGSTITLSYKLNPSKIYLAEINYNLEYPADYDGPVINPIVNNFQTPSIGYWIDENRVLSALYNGPQDVCLDVGDPTSACLTPKLKWTVYAPDGTTILEEKTTTLNWPYQFQFPGNDKYYFEITYVEPPIPAPNLSPGVTLIPTKFTLNVNGVWISGGTTLQDCAVSNDINQCGEADPLEDCSQYDTMVSILGSPEFPIISANTLFCNFKNFGRILQNNLISLFVPRYSFYQNWVDDFQVYLNEKLGFLYASFGLITGIFTGIISGAVSTKCSLAPPGTLFGGTFSVNVCSLQTIVGNTAFGVIQGLVIGLTILALAFASYRKYLEVVDNR